MNYRLLFIPFLLLAISSLAAEPLTVVANNGDGAYSILRRYRLLDYPCNLSEFYRLNQLSRNAILIRGRSYKLPIETIRYDGKSIRSSTNNKDYDRALQIQYYNDDLVNVGVKPADFRADKVLYVPFHIDNCLADKQEQDAESLASSGESAVQLDSLGKAPTQVTTSDYRTFNIFGKKYAYVPQKTDKLAGRVFYIVSGHGGPDPGTIGRRAGHHLHEDEYAYDVALRLTRNILAHGGTPYMIVRDKDGIRDERYLKGGKTETVWGGASIPRQQKARLQQRTDIINQLYADNLAKGVSDQTMISIHVDSRASNKKIDLFFYHHENDLIGARQAQQMQKIVRKKYASLRKGRGYNGTVGPRDLFVLRETLPSGVFIELGNITNDSDQVRIVEPRNRQLLADWLCEGLF